MTGNNYPDDLYTIMSGFRNLCWLSEWFVLYFW